MNLKDLKRVYKGRENQPTQQQYQQQPPQQQPQFQDRERYQMTPDEIAYYKQQEEMIRHQRQQEEEEYQQAQQQYIDQPNAQEEEEYEDEISYSDVPIQKAIEIKHNPTPKGYFQTIIGGSPVDLHALENYLVTTSPFAIKTLMRYNNAEMIEDIKNYSTKGTGRKKMDMKVIFLILLAAGMAVAGIFVMMFMPDLMATFQAGL